MIVHITRDGAPYGSLQCSPAPNNWGEIDTEVWFCPHCGRLYAREEIEFEENEVPHPLVYRVLTRPCYMPLHDLTLPHPTFWQASDAQMLKSALMEHFNGHDTSKCPAIRTSGRG